MHEVGLYAAVCLSLLIVLGAVGAGIAQVLGTWECSSKAQAMSVPYTFGLMQGCVIKAPNGQWVPLSNYRVL